ncbi:MAG: hypothetical protein ACKVX7_09290 [Planctomycetota bacterium]
MGLVDSATSLAGELLGDAPAPAKTKADQPPEFQRGESLRPPQQGGAAAPQLDNAHDQTPIDFIHFGRMHADDGAGFAGAEIDDLQAEATLGIDALSRSAMYRAALQRESLLLYEFIGSLQTILKQYKDSQGPLGGLAGAAMDFLSSDAPGDAPPDPAELDLHREDVGKAGAFTNKAEASFVELHTTGRDLHLYRADYRQFTSNCYQHYVEKKGDGGGPGGALGNLMPDMGFVSDKIKLVSGILFKAFDIYLAMYLAAQKEYEATIEDASYQLSLSAIKGNWRPVYPTWYPQPPAPTQQASTKAKSKPNNAVEKTVADANDKADEVAKSVNDTVADVRDFLGFEKAPPAANGLAPLDQIFARLLPPSPKELARPSVEGIFIAAFKKVLDVPVPEIVITVIREITTANIELLRRVYKAVLYGRGSVTIDAATMARAGSDALVAKMFELAARLIPGLGFLGDGKSQLVSLPGMGQLTGKEAENFLSRYVKDALGGPLGKIAELSSAALAPILEEARKQGGANGSTMEPLLGHLPLVLTLQFRNTFFPLIDLVLSLAFGKTASPLNSALNPVKGFLGDLHGGAKGVYKDADQTYDDAMAKKKDVENHIDHAAKQLSQVDLVKVAKDPGAFADKLMNPDAVPGAGAEAGPPPPPPPFPPASRVAKSRGLPVTAADLDEAEKQQGEMKIKSPSAV